jgi:hypothetical protein
MEKTNGTAGTAEGTSPTRQPDRDRSTLAHEDELAREHARPAAFLWRPVDDAGRR